MVGSLFGRPRRPPRPGEREGESDAVRNIRNARANLTRPIPRIFSTLSIDEAFEILRVEAFSLQELEAVYRFFRERAGNDVNLLRRTNTAFKSLKRKVASESQEVSLQIDIYRGDIDARLRTLSAQVSSGINLPDEDVLVLGQKRISANALRNLVQGADEATLRRLGIQRTEPEPE